ncbi:uncharacterized protein L3040_009570 [Drepanopeziza brunnea f. sp. 'multigermtubi']|uniref:Uncharacterized protein n=1 Tax=Marssonina brunnea f. sp. multigermtubi (strain MB_m1) TaxID=1072389 RepID=K1WUV1_MARBU|nr:uncharacterized protein MBM_05486 [Drepanopeziza brunnea f. sp. 'multigermtubi' MB_m1]EKD16192.1 hypothetical protein MBM_05486 [Drepanopeziza brunnea f. sp. 'multigermtubi' MB_m1]KAJ5032984.1 hypothetical protein L3040_009570 [Drepanopeziza brunnea f. sp. 'multigermtubi']
MPEMREYHVAPLAAEDSDNGDTTITEISVEVDMEVSVEISTATTEYLDVSSVPIFIPGDQTDSDGGEAWSAMPGEDLVGMDIGEEMGSGEADEEPREMGSSIVEEDSYTIMDDSGCVEADGGNLEREEYEDPSTVVHGGLPREVSVYEEVIDEGACDTEEEINDHSLSDNSDTDMGPSDGRSRSRERGEEDAAESNGECTDEQNDESTDENEDDYREGSDDASDGSDGASGFEDLPGSIRASREFDEYTPAMSEQGFFDCEESFPESKIETHVLNLDYKNADSIWSNSMLQRNWISMKDGLIWSPREGLMVSMPVDRIERKRLVINLYLYLIKQIWFVHLGDNDGSWVFRTIPIELWRQVFTTGESKQLQRATRKKILYDLKTRAIAVAEEWRLRFGFPKIPETAKEVEEALTEEARAERLQMKMHFLDDVSHYASVDRWIKFLFRNLMHADRLDGILKLETGVRFLVMEKMVFVTELPFVDSIQWSVTTQYQKMKSAKNALKSVFDQQLSGMLGNLRLNEGQTETRRST